MNNSGSIMSSKRNYANMVINFCLGWIKSNMVNNDFRVKTAPEKKGFNL